MKTLITLFFSPRLFFCILCFLFVSFFTIKSFVLQQTVYGDGIFYYSWLRSSVIDNDIHFVNEYKYFHVNQLQTNTGYVGNQFAIGPALFWSPIYILVHVIFRGDGYSFIYQYMVGLCSVLYCLAGLIFLYRGLLTYTSIQSSLSIVLCIAFASNILFYGSLDTVNSHAVSFFVSTVLFNLIQLIPKRIVVAGFCAGLLGMMRIQDSVFLIIPFFALSNHLFQNKIPFKTFITLYIPQLLLGWCIPLCMQFVAWYGLYGDIRIPYLERGYGFAFLHSSFFSVLLSSQNGLFYWTPLIGVAVLGLVLFRSPLFRFLNIVIVVLFIWQTYLIGSWSIWWQGASFSGRMFISLLPFLSLGLIPFIDRLKNKWVMTGMVFFILYTCAALVLFLIQH